MNLCVNVTLLAHKNSRKRVLCAPSLSFICCLCVSLSSLVRLLSHVLSVLHVACAHTHSILSKVDMLRSSETILEMLRFYFLYMSTFFSISLWQNHLNERLMCMAWLVRVRERDACVPIRVFSLPLVCFQPRRLLPICSIVRHFVKR